jgi:WASH complex subunit strumpellin
MTMMDSVDDDWSSDEDNDEVRTTMKSSVSLDSLERTTTGRTTTASASASTSRTAARAACEFAARAQALVAELGRLADRVPRAVSDVRGKFASVLLDYEYFDSPLTCDDKIESSGTLLELDEEFRASHGRILERYWNAFDACVRWHSDFTRFVEDVTEGTYVSDTMEKLLADEDGKQCVIEAMAGFGLMLKVLNERYDWRVKERVVVAYCRMRGSDDVDNFDEIVRLCRRTGYDASSNTRPEGYHELYFSRFDMPDWLVAMVIGRLRTDDLYNHVPHYPNPDHRSTALAAQGALLYIILHWSPNILHREMSTMRELVDRHYADNWVVAYGAGLTADLLTEWQSYDAASTAMRNAVTSRSARELIDRHNKIVEDVQSAFRNYLTEGVLQEEFVLTNEKALMNVVRDANIVARFLLLHRTSSHASVASAISCMPSKETVVDLLLDCAELENELKRIYTSLLNGKHALWDKCKSEAGDRMRELSAFYGGTGGLSKNAKDENLRRWFAKLSLEVDKLSHDDPVVAARTIKELETALIEVEQFHQIVDNIHAKQYLSDSRNYLGQMMMSTNVADSALNTLTIVSDAAYAWGVVDPYTEQLQTRVRKDPFAVRKLRFLFLKLRSMLEMPLLRVSEIESEDIYSISEYYSSQLITYVRLVVEVVPISMFEILNEIIGVQTTALKELPTKLEKLALQEYAQPGERRKLSEATYQISIFTQGILAMESTFMGVIELDPKQLLEEGIRKQLVKQITEAFQNAIVFGDQANDTLGWNNFVAALMKSNTFEDRLSALAQRLEGFRRSFEYIQDYVNIYGLQVWQEETSRVISYHVEQECNAFMKRRQLSDGESEFQSVAIPIPDFPPVDGESKNFMGRLMRELLRQTDPKSTRYIGAHSAWFSNDGKEVVGIRTFALLTSAIGNVGLAGLDRLLSFMITQCLQKFIERCSNSLVGELGTSINVLKRAIHPLGGIPDDAATAYSAAAKASTWEDMIDALALIGQAQLLRRQLNAELVANVRIDSHTLSRALSAANDAILTDIRAHYQSPDTTPYPDEGNVIIPKLSAYLSASGMQNPLRQIYCTVDPIEDWGLLLFIFTIAQLSLYEYDDVSSSLVTKNRATTPADASVLIHGVSTALKQFHAEQTTSYLTHLGQYVRHRVVESSDAHACRSVRVAVAWAKQFAIVADIPARRLAGFFPPFVLEHAHSVLDRRPRR